MKKLLALLLLLWTGPAFAQSNPGWTFGFVPTAAQWNAEWSSKVDVNLAGIPVTSGGTGGIIWGAGNPLIGAGSGALTQGTRSGNTTVFGTVNGVLTAGDCVSLDSSFNLVDAGGVCTTGGGGGTVTSGLINQLAWYNANGYGCGNARRGVLDGQFDFGGRSHPGQSIRSHGQRAARFWSQVRRIDGRHCGFHRGFRGGDRGCRSSGGLCQHDRFHSAAEPHPSGPGVRCD